MVLKTTIDSGGIPKLTNPGTKFIAWFPEQNRANRIGDEYYTK
jgi:hypothetical protein